jgi:hypothetical protein
MSISIQHHVEIAVVRHPTEGLGATRGIEDAIQVGDHELLRIEQWQSEPVETGKGPLHRDRRGGSVGGSSDLR